MSRPPGSAGPGSDGSSDGGSGPRSGAAERHRRVKELFLRVVDLPQEQRGTVLDEACAGDASLRGEVESLLALETGGPGEDRGADTGASPPEPQLQPGSRVGGERGYRILEELGAGGMGRVYLAERLGESFSQRVALKVLRTTLATDEARLRFDAERRHLSRLEHPGIARLIDGGRLPDGSPFLAMELVEGRPLDVAVREDALPLRERLRLMIEVCEAVEAAHRALVVHRDLKPSNILVTGEGRIRLVDFGIAKSLDPELEPAVTRLGQPLTPRYAAPEQILGEPVTVATDVYSLGVVLYELLTGESPYPDEDLSHPARLVLAVCQGDPAPPSTVGRRSARTVRTAALAAGRGATRDLDAIVLEALRKDPAERYGSVAELAADLRRHLDGEPVRARRGGLLYRAERFARRHRLAVVGLALLLGVLVAWALTLRTQLARVEEERARAEAVTGFLTGLFEAADPERLEPPIEDPRDLVTRGVERVGAELADRPELRARLQLSLARISWSLDLLAQAGDLAEAAAAHASRLGPAERLELEHVRIGILRDRGESAAALERLPGALELARELGDVDTELTLLNQEAILHDDRGDSRQAVELYREILRRGLVRVGLDRVPDTWGEEVRGRKDLHFVSRTLYNLGVSLELLAEWDEALLRHRQARDLRRALVGDRDHPTLMRSANAVGNILSGQGRYREARNEYLEGLRIAGQIGQEDDEDVALLLVNLSGVERQLRELDAAAEHLERARALLAERRGPDHPWTAVATMNLGNVRADQGRLEEALDLYRDALGRLENHFEGPHFRVGAALVNVAGALERLGRPDEALAIARRALEVHHQADGAGHPRTLEAELRVGNLLATLGRCPEALAPAVRAVEGLEAAADGTGALQAARFLLARCEHATASDAATRAAVVARVRALRPVVEALESADHLGVEAVDRWLEEVGGGIGEPAGGPSR